MAFAAGKVITSTGFEYIIDLIALEDGRWESSGGLKRVALGGNGSALAPRAFVIGVARFLVSKLFAFFLVVFEADFIALEDGSWESLGGLEGVALRGNSSALAP